MPREPSPISVQFFRKASSRQSRQARHVDANFTSLLTEKNQPIWLATAKRPDGAASFVIKRYVRQLGRFRSLYVVAGPDQIPHIASDLSVVNMAVAGD